MTIITNRKQRRELERQNAKRPKHLVQVPREDWPENWRDPTRTRVFRSRDFIVQEFACAAPVLVRISVNRTSVSGDRWDDGIAWDDLQRIKNAIGYTALDAVEVYPSILDEVNVANMRHLWVLREPLSFAWRRLPPKAAGTVAATSNESTIHE